MREIPVLLYRNIGKCPMEMMEDGIFLKPYTLYLSTFI